MGFGIDVFNLPVRSNKGNSRGNLQLACQSGKYRYFAQTPMIPVNRPKRFGLSCASRFANRTFTVKMRGNLHSSNPRNTRQ
jgi:hypothetical protein